MATYLNKKFTTKIKRNCIVKDYIALLLENIRQVAQWIPCIQYILIAIQYIYGWFAPTLP